MSSVDVHDLFSLIGCAAAIISCLSDWLAPDPSPHDWLIGPLTARDSQQPPDWSTLRH